MTFPSGFDLLGRSGPSIVISNFRDPENSDVIGLLRAAADAAERLRQWTDPDTGEVVEHEVIFDVISASTRNTPDGPVHAITLGYRYVDETRE